MTPALHHALADAMEQIAAVFVNDRRGGLVGRNLVAMGIEAAIRDLTRARETLPSRDEVIRASRDWDNGIDAITRRIMRRGDARHAETSADP